MLIQEKAKRLLDALTKDKEKGVKVKSLWLVGVCLNGLRLQNLKVQGEAASADKKATTNVPSTLAITREGFTMPNKYRWANSGSICQAVYTLPRKKRQHQVLKPARRDLLHFLGVMLLATTS